MGKVLVFGNEKGGSGKTTTAFHIVTVLLKKSKRVLIIDADIRQKSFTRYLENRKQAIEKDKLKLELPYIIDIKEEFIIEGEGEKLEKIIEEKKKEFDFIIVDTPGNYTKLSKVLHKQADIIVTPINDSFIDVDLLGQVDGNDLTNSKAGVYSNMVFECKKKRAMKNKKEIDWYVIRNRMSSTITNNMKNIEEALKKLSLKYGFKIISGFGDRVIFKELFLEGLTLSDAKLTSKIKMNLSTVAARSELRDIIGTIEKSL
ncbi:division plane positioning ATPase MipZ [Rickettsiales endosymbiont of Trichoplax sp. H2]|uniref:division plane positioning ATPase MipZ n=1 Tax=Rickettsiales endosymbiont of Trichoplax sp. H2 TaxID=2021221 RepID=UPI0012B36965|nr:division plane positioning ATPase MipZ [Rickettsiales endosymbiont of Trichoplax sp. H2]MSO13541.1 Septum site-determining protein MinD [Rickettsiales endosymbiont of Trichoplax sp. H2]